jgi:hypothetical protein
MKNEKKHKVMLYPVQIREARLDQKLREWK